MIMIDDIFRSRFYPISTTKRWYIIFTFRRHKIILYKIISAFITNLSTHEFQQERKRTIRLCVFVKSVNVCNTKMFHPSINNLQRIKFEIRRCISQGAWVF